MVRVSVVSSVASSSAAAMVQVAARGALLVVAMSTAWAVRLLPMMAVMIATGIIFFAFWYERSPCPWWARAPTEVTTRC